MPLRPRFKEIISRLCWSCLQGPFSNVQVVNSGSAGHAGFAQCIVVKTTIQTLRMILTFSILLSKQNSHFLERKSIKKYYGGSEGRYKLFESLTTSYLIIFTVGLLKLDKLLSVKFQKCLKAYQNCGWGPS